MVFGFVPSSFQEPRPFVSFSSPLHLCDVKAEHFGLSDNGRVKYLDLDSVQLRPLADRTVGDSTECREQTDCDFFDCRGRCDLLTHRCTGGVVNNNMQLVCEKVFLGGEGWGARGLLDSRHASIALRHAVAECANPTGQFGLTISLLSGIFSRREGIVKKSYARDKGAQKML